MWQGGGSRVTESRRFFRVIFSKEKLLEVYKLIHILVSEGGYSLVELHNLPLYEIELISLTATEFNREISKR